jgi:hypothetical protein
MYIDSEGAFCSEDIKAIAKGFQLDPQLTLNNVAVRRVGDYSQMLNSLYVAGAMMQVDNTYVLRFTIQIISNIQKTRSNPKIFKYIE